MNLRRRLDDLEQRVVPPAPEDAANAPLCYSRNEPFLYRWRAMLEKDPEKREAMRAEIERRGLCACKTCREHRAAAAERPRNPELLRLIRVRAGLPIFDGGRAVQ